MPQDGLYSRTPTVLPCNSEPCPQQKKQLPRLPKNTLLLSPIQWGSRSTNKILDTDVAGRAPHLSEWWQNMPNPPEPFQFDDTLDAWKKAVKNLRASSARGFDAVSAQEFKLIPDGLLQELIHVCNNYETGVPTWFMRTRVCPLNKTDDTPLAQQSRPICIMSQTYRLFVFFFAHRFSVSGPPFFQRQSLACCQPEARGSHDAAYAMQMMIEIAKSQGQKISGLTLDIKKVFQVHTPWSRP